MAKRTGLVVRPDAPARAPGRPPTGPLPVYGETLPPLDRAEVARLVPSIDADAVEEIGGLLDSFNGRARRVCLGLLGGASLLQAAASAGVARNTVDHWRQTDAAFQRAVGLCLDLGSALYEGELHSRALAGPDDRGSMRALELVVKARNPDYRDKQQIQMGVLHVFKQGLSDAGGWRSEALPGPDVIENP